ncbi:hypothetical protein CGRA01v4_06206 [Colletotrichum graminicola]|nr:hypothetical protein CGRA01v4_06206 [Colletotrichum graminicola]
MPALPVVPPTEPNSGQTQISLTLMSKFIVRSIDNNDLSPPFSATISQHS